MPVPFPNGLGSLEAVSSASVITVKFHMVFMLLPLLKKITPPMTLRDGLYVHLSILQQIK